MITIKLTDKPVLEQQADGLVFFVESTDLASKQLAAIAKQFYPPLQEEFKKRGFTGAAGSTMSIAAISKNKPIELIFAGLGDASKNYLEVEKYRRAIGSIVRIAERLKLDHIALSLADPKLFNVDYAYLAEQTAIILHMASYHFDQFITDSAAKLSRHITVNLCIDKKFVQEIEEGIKRGEIIARATNKARLWVDTPPSHLPPEVLAHKAHDIARENNLKIAIFNEEAVNKMGMGGLAGVSRGSELDCCFVVLEYKTAKKNAPTIAIVGKGITFDSGGLSIKPAQSMETMKEDMSGAAAVIATMEVIGIFKPDINVVACVPIAENLPSGSAIKPGDILTFYNGMTADVKNTDAEGRLILADALSYAIKNYKLDAIIDLATLTGACAFALGPFFSGMMGKHEELMKRVERASETSGDRVWRLPFDDDYKAAIKSDVADMSNIGSQKYRAGATTAGFFLMNFVGDVPWVHLDIAGVAFDVPDMSYFRPGATGYGVRLLSDLLLQWK